MARQYRHRRKLVREDVLAQATVENQRREEAGIPPIPESELMLIQGWTPDTAPDDWLIRRNDGRRNLPAAVKSILRQTGEALYV